GAEGGGDVGEPAQGAIDQRGQRDGGDGLAGGHQAPVDVQGGDGEDRRGGHPAQGGPAVGEGAGQEPQPHPRGVGAGHLGGEGGALGRLAGGGLDQDHAVEPPLEAGEDVVEQAAHRRGPVADGRGVAAEQDPVGRRRGEQAAEDQRRGQQQPGGGDGGGAQLGGRGEDADREQALHGGHVV